MVNGQPLHSELKMIVQLRRKNSRYPDLTPNKKYVVIGIEADDLRILSDQGKPYLYPARLFDLLDNREPKDWITEFGSDNERYAYPSELLAPGFFEDFFDNKRDAVSTFWQVVNRRLAAGQAVARRFRDKDMQHARIGMRPRAA